MIALIDRQNIEDYIKCIRGGEVPPDILLNLSILQQPGSNSREARSIRLSEVMLKFTVEEYQRARKSENLPAELPETRLNCSRQIKEDFSLGNPSLESWSVLYFRYFSSVSINVEELSTAANVVPQQFRRRLNQGLSYLVDLLRRREMENETRHKSINRNLPLPDYTRLVGIQPVLDQLSQELNQKDGSRMVSIEGIGGIGKTAAARAFVSLPETSSHWPNILWISARQAVLDDSGHLSIVQNAASSLEDITDRLADQLGIGYLSSKPVKEKMDGIQAALNLQPYLVVIDNLETVDDSIELIPALAKFSGTSRFLITSRQTLRTYPFVYTFQLSELNDQSSFELLELETSRRGRSSQVEKNQFADLYSVIGGIPLAIKLVAAQLHIRPLAEILKEFKNANRGVEDFYRYIYWKIWQDLSDPAHRLLLSFLSADPEGEDLGFLQVMSGQTEEEFFQAVEELDQVSLLEISGTSSEPHYRLHRLTVTFLQTELLDFWDKTRAHQA